MRIAIGSWATLLILAACSAEPAAPPGDEPAGPDTAEMIDDGKADSTELRVRTGVTTLWVDKVAVSDVNGGQPRVTIRARTSRDLKSVHSWVPDDAFGSASIVGPRSFDVVLDEGHEINTLLSGLPILVTIDTKTGSPSRYTARLELAMRFAKVSGSSKLVPSTVVAPIYLRDAENPLRYRGKIRTTEPASALVVETGEGEAGNPVVSPIDTLDWRFDWTYDGLVTAGFPPGDRVDFVATVESGALMKSAELEARVLRLSMTTKDPSVAWPEKQCEADVLACVKATAGADLGECGTYREVSRCVGQAVSHSEQFVSDFAAHLVGYYASFGADIAAMGGNTLEQAQQAISLGAVTELTDPEEDPYAHDFETTIVLSHPDVVFPGSDIVWFGAYDRASGELIEIYDFN